ncbi:hypothetical protein LNQ03_03320 [Klebsiella pneumoniae subsp. pneumoniae]|nr:hypothetical protein [Klebsiella pneumoniae subsp. pneumoniae]
MERYRCARCYAESERIYHTRSVIWKMGWSLYTLELLRLIPRPAAGGAGFPVALRHSPSTWV